MIRVVFDTNILFSAIYKKTGIPAQVLDFVTAGVLTPCISDPVMEEYEDVLTRPVLREHASRVKEVLAYLRQLAVYVKPIQELDCCSDPDDNRFLECAHASGAVYLVTGNARHFPKTYAGTTIVTPRTLLDRLLQHKI